MNIYTANEPMSTLARLFKYSLCLHYTALYFRTVQNECIHCECLRSSFFIYSLCLHGLSELENRHIYSECHQNSTFHVFNMLMLCTGLSEPSKMNTQPMSTKSLHFKYSLRLPSILHHCFSDRRKMDIYTQRMST